MTSILTENSPKRRDKLVIIAEILDIARTGCSKTHIMFQANLSFTQLNQYLPILTQTNLLEKILDDKKEVYKSTEKGLDFMERQCQIINLLNGKSNGHVKTSFEFNTDLKRKALHVSHNSFSSILQIKQSGTSRLDS